VRWLRFLPGLLMERVLARFQISEIIRGAVEAIGMVLVGALAALPLFIFWIPLPSESTLSQIADVGIVLVLAYAVEGAWLVLVPHLAEEEDYENRLGAIAGIGIAGMFGVVCALMLAAHRAAGHANALDFVGFAWVVFSLSCLAGVVVSQPLLVHVWERPEKNG
jgi:hypothetical protein